VTSSAWIKEKAGELGFDNVGVCPAVRAPNHAFYESWLRKGYHGTMGYLARQADLKRSPQELLPGARSIVAVALNYNQEPMHRPGRPKIARYALGRDYHKVLRAKLRRLAAALQAEHPEAGFRACVDSAPIFERDYARLAGLGWFGKNTMLIDSRRGSWFFIGLLLTTLELEPDVPAEGGCGTCTRCIDACPTGAIVFEHDRWQIDSRRCISYLTIEHRGEVSEDLARGVGEWTFGCDVCQEVCPFNEPRPTQPLRAASTREGDFLERREWPPLRELTELPEAEWDILTRGSAVRRTGSAGLRRNSRLNLANAATEEDQPIACESSSH
jgi:epoxyqueuosine reductase